jgi:hypothetical protein
MLGSILRVLALLWTSRHGDQWVQVVTNVYIRGSHNRVVELELAPHSTGWWATERALIAFDDRRDANEYRLLLRGKPLHPRRSLAHSGVRNGDTLELVTADTVAPRSPGLATRLYSRALARLRKHKR